MVELPETRSGGHVSGLKDEDVFKNTVVSTGDADLTSTEQGAVDRFTIRDVGQTVLGESDFEVGSGSVFDPDPVEPEGRM